MTSPTNPVPLVEHFFRHESGKLITSLVRRFGLRHFELVEDVVQSALSEALLAWRQNGVPENPAAWIRQVAKNRFLDKVRREKRFDKIAEKIGASDELEIHFPDTNFDADEINDSILRVLFACCHPELSPDASIPLTLKTVCGFSEAEIASCLLIPKATVRKRIYRAKRAMILRDYSLELPDTTQLSDRLQTVHNVLYLMFNEGYSSSCSDDAIRLDVCEEAARLCHLMTENRNCSNRTTHAILALMLFHAARFGARIDHEGSLVLLEDQDRLKWDQRLIHRAAQYFRFASEGQTVSNYHLEAAIAMYHCSVDQFANTNWDAIISLYGRLIENNPTPVYLLNQAIAIGQRDGPSAALAILHDLRDDPQLKHFHLLESTLGEFYRRAGEVDTAMIYFENALKKANSESDKKLLQRRIEQLK